MIINIIGAKLLGRAKMELCMNAILKVNHRKDCV